MLEYSTEKKSIYFAKLNMTGDKGRARLFRQFVV